MSYCLFQSSRQNTVRWDGRARGTMNSSPLPRHQLNDGSKERKTLMDMGITRPPKTDFDSEMQGLENDFNNRTLYVLALLKD